MKPVRRRNPQLDLLRIVFATLVLLAHAPEIIDGNESREIFSRLTRSQLSFGDFAVDGFFVLSGFLIVQSWDVDPNWRRFLGKRVLRILPGYIVAALLSTLVVGLLAPGAPHFFRHIDSHFPRSLLLLSAPATPLVFPGLRGGVHVNASLWTITYEFRCYVLVMLLGLCGLVRKPLLSLTITLGLLILRLGPILSTPRHWQTQVLGAPSQDIRLTLMFMAGACFYLFRKKIHFRRSLAILAIAAIILPAADRDLIEPYIAVFGGYLIFYWASLDIDALSFMRRVPDISYGVYLYGWPVECLWVWYFHESPWTSFVVATLLTYCFGWFSWEFVERPILRLKPVGSAPISPA